MNSTQLADYTTDDRSARRAAHWANLPVADRESQLAAFQAAGWTCCPHDLCPPNDCRETYPAR